MQINNFHSEGLHIDNFQLTAGEAWCFLGANNSGVGEFIQLISDNLKLAEEVDLPDKTVVVSFARLQEIFEEELKKDDTNFLDRIDAGTPARAFLDCAEQLAPLIKAFNLEDCLDKGFRQLSTGESRKLLLLSSISTNPDTIVIENPYDGLDIISCQELDHALQSLHQLGRQIIVTVNNDRDIPSWCTHLAVLQGGYFALQGKQEDVLPQISGLKKQKSAISLKIEVSDRPIVSNETELIALSNGYASYGDTIIFSHLNMIVKNGQHTLITGPNGSGKSTLLQIITGDNQKCYANNLRIFGRQRGTGESIWELKKKMGIFSPDLHRNHYIPGSALQVVLSGFFDSIGVYRNFSEKQRQDALKWLKMTGLQNKALSSFRQLSFAEQRLCLIARALIKMPRLLILDEPTQGLDQENRKNLLNSLERIAEKKLSTILYASHRSDEFRPFFKQHIDLSIYRPH
jgi:molybdate transport system ATP-binding protein